MRRQVWAADQGRGLGQVASSSHSQATVWHHHDFAVCASAEVVQQRISVLIWLSTLLGDAKHTVCQWSTLFGSNLLFACHSQALAEERAAAAVLRTAAHSIAGTAPAGGTASPSGRAARTVPSAVQAVHAVHAAVPQAAVQTAVQPDGQGSVNVQGREGGVSSTVAFGGGRGEDPGQSGDGGTGGDGGDGDVATMYTSTDASTEAKEEAVRRLEGST